MESGGLFGNLHIPRTTLAIFSASTQVIKLFFYPDPEIKEEFPILFFLLFS